MRLITISVQVRRRWSSGGVGEERAGGRVETIKKLRARYGQIEARGGTMYMDKLDGRMTQEFFDKQAATFRR
jgi:hypothetical protein